VRAAGSLCLAAIGKAVVWFVVGQPRRSRIESIKAIFEKGAKIMTQKRLSSKEKSRILKLKTSGEPVITVAKRLKRDPATVRKFLNEPHSKEILADMYERLNRKILESVTPEDIEKANLLQKTTAAAIATDKTQLLRGNPTQIQVAYLVEAVEMIRQMRKLERPQLRNATDATLSVVEAKER
jgi:hypothetical protein